MVNRCVICDFFQKTYENVLTLKIIHDIIMIQVKTKTVSKVMVKNMKINLSTKFNGSTICVFGSFDDVKVHIANIDLKVNRVYTTHDGYKYIRNCNKCNNVMMYDDDFDKCVDDNELKKRGSQLPIHKMNVMFEFHAHELPMIIRECQKTFYVE